MSGVRGFAERVLFGHTLDDKLAAPEGRHDVPGAPLAVPRAPGRPHGLGLDDPRPRPPPPRRRDLDSTDGRGRVLHGFANHELLALELMALMLLRFPEAPVGWRQGLVQTMLDEQRHLQAYLDRMGACGVPFGEEPVSSFFWDTLAAVPDPLAFTAAMGLGFEQANLDFARVWGQAFSEAGDGDTAAVLHEVYEDEVRHVRHAVAWYPRLGGALDFDDWSGRLVFPMSVARARGPRVDREGRRRAGIPEDFVRRLEVSGASRGRPPVVWRFRASLEDEVAGRTPSRVARAVERDLQHLPLLLAHHEDLVLAEPASVAFLQSLRDAGFVPAELGSTESLRGRTLGGVEPWGVTPRTREQLGVEGWNPALATLWAKDAAVPWQEALLEARVCSSLEAVRDALPDGPWVIKARWSASGTLRIRGEGRAAELPAAVGRWLLSDGAVVVQRWLDRVLDLSVHGDVTHEGVAVRGVVRFETGPGGVFRGAWVGPWLQGLPAPLQRWAQSPVGWVEARLHEAWKAVAELARSQGFRGALGVDAMVVDHAGELRLVPVVEINPRRTLGRFALDLRKRLSPRARGWWRLSSISSMEGRDPVAWLRQRDRPLELDGGRLLRGVLATNDPHTASVVVGWLDL